MNRRVVRIAVLCPVLTPAAAMADVTGRIDVRAAAGATAAPTVVYAEPLDRRAPVRPVTARLAQKDKTFSALVVAVPVGSTVVFPNDDPLFHNVFSLSSPAPFDLGLYRAGASRTRTFTQPGSYRVFCNIHPQMTAFIVVVPTPYVTVTGADGRYTLDVPAGTYRVTARSDRATPVSVGRRWAWAPQLCLTSCSTNPPTSLRDVLTSSGRTILRPRMTRRGDDLGAEVVTEKPRATSRRNAPVAGRYRQSPHASRGQSR